MRGSPDIAQLRNLLFGKEYDDLLALKEQFEHSGKYSASVANVISEAISQRAQRDDSLTIALSPMVEQTLTHAIQSQPKRFADVLYPVMGPAIRKSIQQALNELLESINQLLEQSFSLRAWRWRFDAWLTGKSYAQIALMHTLVYQVEQVFLIHRETGLLLHHLVAEKAISKDPEIVSGMLTAIQDFVKDSFTTNSEDTLDTLRLGDLTVLVEHGPYAITALVVRGTPPGELRALLTEISENIHDRYAQPLKSYDGDTSRFAGIETLLAPCLKHQYHPRRQRKPWLAMALLALLLAGGAYAIYAYRHGHSQADQPIAVQQPQQAQQNQQALMDNLQQLKQALAEQQSRNATLETSLQTLQEQQKQREEQQTRQTAANEQQLATLVKQLEASTFPFINAKADVDPDNPGIQQTGQTIRQLLQTAQLADKTPQITIIGNTDENGTDTINKTLAEERAANMRDALIQTGIPAFVLRAQAAHQTGAPATSHKNERSIRYKVELY
ncbi:OmpA family protein [Candidatus Thiothrix sp. Deng01]|uniref:OmpA family protein n=1 Tax=Candidatus Thiothrix phosphatis TaxID=3112415 RepID=A0ABU6CWV9_9GAMM|nr:OmpA family protein [Candidatus Thiothrix sp. Deng01]MEB4591032.1 OmpA family protein [Candidatus Thiothrix sp. Deng01]